MNVQISVLGGFRVLRDGADVPAAAFGGRLTRRLVRILVVAGGAAVRRDALADALWGDVLPSDPAANLKVLVNRARSAIGRDAVLTVPGGYALASAPTVEVDAEAFLRLVAQARHRPGEHGSRGARDTVHRALRCWGDPLAEDLDESWASAYRTRLLHAHEEALEMAAESALEAGDVPTALEHADALLSAAPLRETAHRLRMRAFAAAGDTAAALAAYAHLQSVLAHELGADPSGVSQQLHLRLLQGERARAGVLRTGPAPPPLRLVGRDAQLDKILAAVHAPAHRPVLIAAPAGHGKSRLLSEVGARAGLPVLSAGARLPLREEDWSLARPLVRQALELDADAFAAVPHRAAVALADTVPEAAELRHLPDLALDPRARRALTVEAVTRLVEHCHAPRVLVLVDDLQWADASSTALLAHLVGQLDKLRVVLAYRPEDLAPDAPATRLVRELPAAAAHLVRLPVLTDDDLADLVDDRRLRSVLAARTDRSPFIVAEVLGALAERRLAGAGAAGRWAAHSTAATTVAGALAEAGQKRMITARLRTQARGRRDVIELLALLGRPASISLIASALDRGPDALADDLKALAEAGLVHRAARGWQVSHDLIAATVTRLLDAPRRAGLHTRLAAVLTDPAEIAAHLAGAGDAAAARMYATAADDRLARYAAGEALELAEAGLAQRPDPATRRRLLSARADARSHTGDLAGARDDLRAVLREEPSGAGRAHLLSRLTMLTVGADDLPRAAALAELALLEATPFPRPRAEALAAAAVVDMNIGQESRSRRRSSESLRLLQRLGDSRRVAEVDDDRAMAIFLAGDIRGGVDAFARTARLLLDCGDLVHAVTPRSTRGHGLVFLARPAEALAETTTALDLARSLAHPEAEAYALWHHSEALSASGCAEQARAAATSALAIARRLDHRGWTATAYRAIGIAEEQAGDLEAAAAAFTSSLDTATHLPLFSSWAAARLALVHLACRRPVEAEPLVQRALSTAPPLALYEARLARCELALARAESATATTVTAAIDAAAAGGHEASLARLREILAAAAGCP